MKQLQKKGGIDALIPPKQKGPVVKEPTLEFGVDMKDVGDLQSKFRKALEAQGAPVGVDQALWDALHKDVKEKVTDLFDHPEVDHKEVLEVLKSLESADKKAILKELEKFNS